MATPGATPEPVARQVGMIERLRAMTRPPASGRVAVSIVILIVAIFSGIRVFDLSPWTDTIFDHWAYWSTRFGLDYAATRPGETGHYLYSPAFAHLISPLTALPWPVFCGLWTAMLGAVLIWLTGRRSLVVGLLPPVTLSIAIGQLDVLIAAAIILGFRWPGAWAFAITTKLTPGIGLLWFLVRREWRQLGIALAWTAGVVGVSFVLDPEAWLGWLGMLERLAFPTPADGTYLPVPVWVRLPLVALLIAWGARTNRRWVLPVGVAFSLPTVWLNTPAIMVALVPLLAYGADAPAAGWLRSEGRLVALARVGVTLRWARLRAHWLASALRTRGLPAARSRAAEIGERVRARRAAIAKRPLVAAIARRISVQRRISGGSSGVDR